MINAHAEGQNFTYHDFKLDLKVNITSVKESKFY